MNDEHIQSLCTRLCAAGTALDESVVARLGSEPDSPEGVVLVRTVRYVRRNCDAAALLLRNDFGDQALVLARVTFESAARLLWSSRAAHGIQRLQAHWANEDLKIARDLLEIDAKDERAQRMFEHRRRLANQELPDGSRLPELPGLPVLLKEIEQQDNTDGLCETDGRTYKSIYVLHYRLPSAFAHGHPLVIRGMPLGLLALHAIALLIRSVDVCRLGVKHSFTRAGIECNLENIGKDLEAMPDELADLGKSVAAATSDPSGGT